MSAANVNNTIARRFEKLLRYLEKTPGEFARDTGLDPSYISRLRSGARQGVGGNLHHKVADAYGIDPSYWTNPIEREPGECMRQRRPPMPLPTPVYVAPPAPKSGPQPVKEAIMELAIQRGDGPERMMSILRAMPPEGKENSLAWWIGFYVDLVTR